MAELRVTIQVKQTQGSLSLWPLLVTAFFSPPHHHPSLGGTGWDTATFPHQPVLVFENRLHLSSLGC